MTYGGFTLYTMQCYWGGVGGVGGGVVFKPNQLLPNQNLTICLFQAQSRFGLVLFRVKWLVLIKTKANLNSSISLKFPTGAKIGKNVLPNYDPHERYSKICDFLCLQRQNGGVWARLLSQRIYKIRRFKKVWKSEAFHDI